MNYKRIIGLMLFIFGVALFVFSIHAMHEIAQAKAAIAGTSGAFNKTHTNNPLLKSIGGAAEKKVSSYDTPVLICFIAGIIIAAAGATTFFYFKSKKRFRRK